VTVGYPAVEGQLSDRLPIDAIIHHEQYKDYDSERINNIYAAKEALPESAKFINENGKETLAQVFTDIRYNQADNEYFSKVFADFIREKGFEI
ncbi:MAG: NADPH-dependent oxidoreductase, partial [Muribaculaceae bacterium]|nr:NADPH-dependent oxidoreductase [Muribaculaceae bacterium]